jgi:hypothetical protein
VADHPRNTRDGELKALANGVRLENRMSFRLNTPDSTTKTVPRDRAMLGMRLGCDSGGPRSLPLRWPY